MSAVATIRARDLELALAAAKLRKFTAGRTCQLCALSEAPMIERAFECDPPWMHGTSKDERRAEAMRFGMTPARAMPMRRGRIGKVFERVQREHGRREVLRTWGLGVRALLAEPQHVLNGGSAS